MCQRDRCKQAIGALPLNVVTFVSFVLPRTDLAATTLSGWGFNLLALFQLVLILLLLIRFFRPMKSSRS